MAPELVDHIPGQLRPTAKYGQLQRDGAQRREWMEDAGKPGCFVERATLTFDAFRQQYPVDDPIETPFLGDDLTSQAVQLGLPGDNPEVDGMYHLYRIECFRLITWHGMIGPGVLVLDNIERPPSSSAPVVSEISQALYQRHCDMESLKHVFVTSIVNEGTLAFITKRLYSAANGLSWQIGIEDVDAIPRTWEYGTAEYDALLGTRIGKTIAYLVLGAFERGTRHVARIVSWPGDRGASAYLRFDIEARVP